MTSPANLFQCSVLPPLVVDTMVLILGVHRDLLPPYSIPTLNKYKTIFRNCKNKQTNKTTTNNNNKIDVGVHIFSFHFINLRPKIVPG